MILNNACMHYISKMTVLGADKGWTSIENTCYKNITYQIYCKFAQIYFYSQGGGLNYNF